HDLPAEAAAEAELSRSIGLRSHLVLPLKAGATVVGFLGLGTFRAARRWPPELVSALETLAKAIAYVLERRRRERRARAALTEIERAKAELEASRREVRELRERLDAETVYLRKEVVRASGFEDIVGTSAVLSEVLYQVGRVAAADAPVLILGETGTGK